MATSQTGHAEHVEHGDGRLPIYGLPPCIIAGSASYGLARRVAEYGGIERIGAKLTRYPDSELHVKLEDSVRGRDAYVIQSTSAPTNENLMELLILLDTLRRASAGRITAITPYYGYARQDRKSTGREPITAKLVANLITTAGADRVLALDLHSPAIQGFFDIGMDHSTAVKLLAADLKPRLPANSVIVSPDTGGVKRADQFVKALGLPLAILHKRRASEDSVEIAAVIGDVAGCAPVIVDDIIATGGTIRKAVETLLAAGALPDARVVATHGVLCGDVVRNLTHPAISEIVVTDTIEPRADVLNALPLLRVVGIGHLLADCVNRLHTGLSLSELFTLGGVPPVEQHS
jgi:ribose-phosphate pyrophosphokinase